MKTIKKRNGKIEEFNFSKIEKAVRAAFDTVDSKFWDEKAIQTVLGVIEDSIKIKNPDNVEDIQNIVEDSLMCCGHYKVARNYILYREKHTESRFIQSRLDYMDKYSNSNTNAATASETDSNANVAMKNVANMEGEVYKVQNRLVQRTRMKKRLKELFPEVADQYETDLNNHIIYAHDEASSPAVKNYCMAATLYPMMLEGTGNIDGVTPCAPNDIQSFSGQVTNLVFLLSSQVRGAIALGDYFVALNYYVIAEFGSDWYNCLDTVTSTSICKNTRTVKDAIRKGMKQFIYGVSQPAGNRSYNSPFSNLNFFDSYYFESMFKDFYYPDGTKPEWKAIDTLQRMFLELHRELRLIKPLTFPVTTMCLLHDGNDIVDKEYKELCADELSKGSSFFIYLSDSSDSVASCCRVRNEITDNTFSSTTGLTGIMTGSSNVITLNFNRIVQDWFKTQSCDKPSIDWTNENDPYRQSLCNYIVNILERVYKYQLAFKSLVYDAEERGMYSSSNAGYIYTKKLYSTIGFLGYCEAAQFMELDVNYNKQYVSFIQAILKTIEEQNKIHSIHDKKHPCVFNSEGVPGEDLAVKLYNWDKEDGYVVPDDQNLYSSYFFKQWDPKISVLDKLRLHGKEIVSYCSGGYLLATYL
jgi:ribonucleoside-triphosphate reductase (formate)